MKQYYIIEDQSHCEIMGEYDTFEEAIERLKELRRLGRSGENICPCTSDTCFREYELFGYEETKDGPRKNYRELIYQIGENIDKWYLDEEDQLVDFGPEGVPGKEVLNFLNNVEK